MKSIEIWKERYDKEPSLGSGSGSKGRLLELKVDFINKFINENSIKSLLDFGHGDLSVANLLNVDDYLGIDIFDGTQFNSKNLNIVKSKFDEFDGNKADVVICLDVLYHLLEDEQDYMHKSIDKMIDKSNKFIIIYAHDSRITNQYAAHLFDSKWLQYILTKKDVALILEQEECYPETSAKFFVFKK